MDEWQVKTEGCGDGSYRWLHEPADGGNAHSSGERFATVEAAQAAGEAALVQHREENDAKPQTPTHPHDSRLTESRGELEAEEDPRL